MVDKRLMFLDAHSDCVVEVRARAPLQVITAGNFVVKAVRAGNEELLCVRAFGRPEVMTWGYSKRRSS